MEALNSRLAAMEGKWSTDMQQVLAALDKLTKAVEGIQLTSEDPQPRPDTRTSKQPLPSEHHQTVSTASEPNLILEDTMEIVSIVDVEDSDEVEFGVNTYSDLVLSKPTASGIIHIEIISNESSSIFVSQKGKNVDENEELGTETSVYALNSSLNLCTPSVRQYAHEMIIYSLSSGKPPPLPPDVCRSGLAHIGNESSISDKTGSRQLFEVLSDPNILDELDNYSHLLVLHINGKVVQEKLLCLSFTGDSNTYIVKGSFSIQEWDEELVHLVQDVGELKPTVKTALQEEVVSIETQVRPNVLFSSRSKQVIKALRLSFLLCGMRPYDAPNSWLDVDVSDVCKDFLEANKRDVQDGTRRKILPCFRPQGFSIGVILKLTGCVLVNVLQNANLDQADEVFDAISRCFSFVFMRFMAEALLLPLEMPSPAQLCNWHTESAEKCKLLSTYIELNVGELIVYHVQQTFRLLQLTSQISTTLYDICMSVVTNPSYSSFPELFTCSTHKVATVYAFKIRADEDELTCINYGSFSIDKGHLIPDMCASAAAKLFQSGANFNKVDFDFSVGYGEGKQLNGYLFNFDVLFFNCTVESSGDGMKLFSQSRTTDSFEKICHSSCLLYLIIDKFFPILSTTDTKVYNFGTATRMIPTTFDGCLEAVLYSFELIENCIGILSDPSTFILLYLTKFARVRITEWATCYAKNQPPRDLIFLLLFYTMTHDWQNSNLVFLIGSLLLVHLVSVKHLHANLLDWYEAVKAEECVIKWLILELNYENKVTEGSCGDAYLIYIGLDEEICWMVISAELAMAILKNDESEDGKKQEELMTRIKGPCKDIKDVLGSTDVRESEVTKALSEQCFDDGDLLVWIDTYEYMEQHFVVCFIGDSPGHVHHKGRQFIEVARQRPFKIVPFGEFKRRPQLVFNTLLRALNDGRLTDRHDLIVDFTNTFIIITSTWVKNTCWLGCLERLQCKLPVIRLCKEVRMHLRLELLNELDEIVVFDHLLHEQPWKVAWQDDKAQVEDNFLWFSSPRPPDIADLEDNVILKKGGMMGINNMGLGLAELLANENGAAPEEHGLPHRGTKSREASKMSLAGDSELAN